MTDSIILKEYSNQEGTTSAPKDSSAVASNGEKINEIYFSILYRRKEQEKKGDFVFTKFESKPQDIFVKEIEEQNGGGYFYEKVFKLKMKSKKKEESKKHKDSKNNEDSKKKESKKEEQSKKGEESKKKENKKEHKSKEDKSKEEEIQIEFQIGDKDNYIIRFNAENKLFYFDIDLKKGNKFLRYIAKETINQNVLNYYQKIELFIAALKHNKEEKKIDNLYDESIKLYSKNKGFYLLIPLFVSIVEKQNLCSKLIEEFYKMNKENKNDKNMDRKDDLNDYASTFAKFSTAEVDNIIRKKNYNPFHFYGILFCYLNYYDYNNFENLFKQLYKENREILFEILLIYKTNFLKPIEQNMDFFENFVEYTINKKEFDIFESSLNYISDLETFINVINNQKDKIIEKYGKSGFKPIKIKPNLKINKKEDGKEIENLISTIKSIITDEKLLLIYFSSNFWINILKRYNEPIDINIDICFKLRELLKQYFELIEQLFKDSKDNDELKIKNDIKKYLDRDEFAYVLDKNIKIFIKSKKDNKKEFSDSEILGYFTQYDPYFREDRYKYKIDTFIFDYIQFDSLDKQFIETFKKLKFEEIFKDNINDFLNKIVSKINNIVKFGIIMDLIDIKKIREINKEKSKDKSRDYFYQLKQKYEYVIKKDITHLKGDKLEEAIKIIAKFIKLLYDNDDEKTTIEFLKKIDKEDKKISPLILNELVINCQDEKYSSMKNYIFKKFASDLSNIDTIIKLLDNLSTTENKNNFLKELMKECKFKKEDFYSTNPNQQITILCELFEKGKINISDKEAIGFIDIEDTLDKIARDLDRDITKQKLEEFLSNDEKIVIKRLKLIKMIIDKYNPEEIYHDLKQMIKGINENINELNRIRKLLLIFHNNIYFKDIINITNIIKDINEKTIQSYKNEKTKSGMQEIKKHKTLCDLVESVKDFMLFKFIYDEALGINQEKRFNDAISKLTEIKALFDENAKIDIIYEKNKKVFDKIKDILSNNDQKAEEFIEQINNYYKDTLKDKQELIKDLTILFKSKKYETDLKSIIFFFECINPDDNNWKKKIPKECETLSKKGFDDLKKILGDLKKNNIYNYEDKTNYFKLFTSLYEKKEAIDFLLSKVDKDITYLYDKIEPTNRTITIEKIKDCEECIKVFKEFKNYKKDNIGLFEKIKKEFTDDSEKIKFFVSFSKNYLSIIELDRNDSTSFTLFEKVDDIIQNASLIFKQDNEYFRYLKKEKKENGKKEKTGENEQKEESTNMEELIHLKNRIHIKAPKKEKEKQTKKDLFQEKCEKLNFFKESISNLELIYDNMKVFRTKGSSLPIFIIVEIKYPNIKYFINKKEVNFDFINDYLFRAKIEQISQLDLIYKENKYLRFLYGKLFRRIIKHLDGEAKVWEIIRYILNKTDNTQDINDGIVANPKIADDYVEEYKLYINNSFKNISNYITSMFEKNKTSLQKHYEDLIIKKENAYKGIYLHECDDTESAEEYILKIFLEKIEHLPLAQNVLISSKESSPEEIQAFFYRAILCDYNTLFVIELNDSFSNFQQNIMYGYINSILTYKNKIYNESIKNKVDKANTFEYLKSCIVFVYEKNIKDKSFLIELEKFGVKEIGNIEKIEIEKFENIKIITSDICGLGKSHKIYKMIESSKKQYYHFPLGGILTKEIINKKLSELLKKIKNDNFDYKKIAIHLDLTESEETSIISEFLFSFLITKFYIDNENIIYIPKDIEIYIEIPNCFEDYLSKFGILKIFNQTNISLSEIPKLDLPDKIIKIFNRMLELKTNKDIEDFIKNKIGLKIYSYHQVQIFIKLFISQYSKFKGRLTFFSGDKDVTEECIQDFAKCTTYFTAGGFAKLLNEKKDYTNVDFIELLSQIYDDDLKGTKFEIPLIFTIMEKMKYVQLKIPSNSSKSQTSEEYLNDMKKALNLPNEVEKDKGKLKSLLSILKYQSDDYVITNDNYKKMVLLVYRIKANIPVIIMGETGCGKTALITKLNQLLNNGEITVKIINIHPGIKDEDICKEIKKIDIEANELNKSTNKENNEIWVFFDEINTCQSFSLLTEIFINRTYNGEKMSENIRLIGACNPYRRRKISTEKFGLSRDDEKENDLVYLVRPLPQSLLYYVFSFGSINEKDEKKYIYSIIEKLFSKEEKELHEITRDAIFECHKYLRETFDPSVVSLREISRFSKCVDFFKDYFKKKDEYLGIQPENKEKLYKIKSIICSIYLCYYIRLTDDSKRAQFDVQLRPILLKLVNSFAVPKDEKNIEQPNNNKIENENKENNKEDSKEESKEGSLFDNIEYEDLKTDLRNQGINKFSEFLNLEEEFLIDLIELDKGIGKNNLLKENLFLLFLSVVTTIPLIIIGKPGTGKSLSAQLIYKSMKGKYSKNKFFRKYPQIIQTYFQGSESTNPEDITKLFEMAEGKYSYFYKKIDTKEISKEDLPISMILFDELGLAEKSKTNPLKVLHSKLEYAGKKEGVSFVGISNYSLDAAKINRALVLSVPNLEDRIDQLKGTVQSIVESISDDLYNNQKQIFDILSMAYYEYKNTLIFIKQLTAFKEFNIENNKLKEPIDLTKKEFKEILRMKDFITVLKNEKKIKENFHGNRDLYNFIKEIAIETGRLSSFENNIVVNIIERYIERNFGGIDYEIDIDFNIGFDDIKTKIKSLKDILEDYISKKNAKRGEKKKLEKIKISSVFLFKKVYNNVCGTDTQYQISKENCKKYDLNQCIIDNINDNNNPRYLLLEIQPSLSSLIHQNIKIQNTNKTIEFYDGSPFSDDDNNEYRFKKVNEIQDDAKENKLIILQNLNQIQPYLYDLYNMNYTIKDEQKYARICLDNFNEQLTLVNDSFRIIILVDRRYLKKEEMALLNRLEKMKITFDKLLNEEQMVLTKAIMDEIGLNEHIEMFQKPVKYDLSDLLINCGKEENEGLVYNLYIDMKNNNNNTKIDEKQIKERIYSKISNLLPQDIISILPSDNVIKLKYDEKEYYNFRKYIEDGEYNKYKISIIYTFSGLANIIDGFNNEMSFMISEIRNENQLKLRIDELKKKNENNKYEKDYKILIHFEQFNSNKIQFVSNFIFRNYKEKEKYRYIFIIHIKRNFDFENNEDKKDDKIKKENNPEKTNEGENEGEKKNEDKKAEDKKPKRKKEKKSDRIYSIPNINQEINQIFIDNLNGNEIKLKELLDKSIKEILNNNDKLMNLDKEFKRALSSFVYSGLNEKNKKKNVENLKTKKGKLNEDNYAEEIIKYMDDDEEFKNKIIDKAKDLIDVSNESKGDCKSLVDKIMKNMGKNSLDIISCLLDYIKEQIFNKYLLYIFKFLEDNNFLTTLVEIKRCRDESLDEEIINILKDKFLDIIKMDNNLYEPKFIFNYKIPGLYKLYEKLSDFIKKEITVEYFNNEKDLREYWGTNSEQTKIDFHNNEEILLSNVYDYMSDQANDDIFMLDIIKQIPDDLILKDYITYYLNKYHIESTTKTDINNKLIHLLLNLRFSNKNEIIKNNDKEPIKILIIKIMWIESNINYISNILNIFDLAKQLFNNDENKLYNDIDKIINDENKEIKYIINDKKNPEHTREVNECYYIFLASICYSITADQLKLSESSSDKDKVEIISYREILKKINTILQNLNKDLIISLNEMYIIDELVKVIEFQSLKKINVEKIQKIRGFLRKSAEIIQNGGPDKIKELVSNLDDIYRELLIQNEEIIKEKGSLYYETYYDLLRYIFYKEINKINDENYRSKILEYLIKEKEIIKKSNSILQALLKSFIKINKKTKENILYGKSEILDIIEFNLSEDLKDKQDNYFALTETLLYFFEKNSLIYFNSIFYESKEEKDQILMEKEPMDIFKDCIKYLQDLEDGKSRKYDKQNKYIAKLFCLGYIRIFCQIYVKMFDDDKINYKEPEKIINLINEEKNINKMIRLYIYKILFKKHQEDAFLNKKNVIKYKLEKFTDFKTFLKFSDDEQINYGFETLDNENYEKTYKVLENKKGDKFKNKVKTNEIFINKKLHIDNFYIAASNLVLMHLKREEFIKSDIYNNFYEHICKPLYDKSKYLNLIQCLFNPKTFDEIKNKYDINSRNIEAILYGYRYCINELLVDEADDNDDDDCNNAEDYLYSSLYDKSKISYLAEKYYPGSDIRDEPHYELYSKIKKHFIEKPNDGCYVCLCKKGYYHSVPSGFPGIQESGLTCQNCKKEIGTKPKEIKTEDEYKIEHEIVKRDDYYRIFKNEEEINELRKDKIKREKLNKINYMTLEEFEQKYMNKLYEREKGLPDNIDKNYYLRDNKIIRNLSQISYRLLNYILYSHLFFARIFTNKDRFDNYKPQHMSWGGVIDESFILLKNELSKNGINSIEIFMNHIFKDLFEKMHNKKTINEYKELIDFEKELENLIQEKIKKSNEEIKKYNENKNKNSGDKTSAINLLNEKYDKDFYDKKEYPCYEYFYYSDYLDENYLMDEILIHHDTNKYPLLNKYINYKKNRGNNDDKYTLNKFILFNKVLCMISEKYSHKITREYAEKTILKDAEIYKNAENSKSIDKFIKFYNDLKIVDSKKKEFKLKVDKNKLSDFVIDDNNEIGKTYKDIYKIFIDKQNNELKDLLDIKIKEGIFNINCKNEINAQQIKEDEIFNFKTSEKFSFIETIYNSSYRKIIDTQNYTDYNSFKINVEDIEENMTELLLKNKKLINKDLLIEFRYNNEIFDNQVNDLMTTFKKYYITTDISKDDKEYLFNCIKENKANFEFYEIIINNLIILVDYLNSSKKEDKDDNDIKGDSEIYQALKNIEDNISHDFLNKFKEKGVLTINKIPEIFNWFIKLMFKDIKDEIINYQEQKEEKDNKKEDDDNKYLDEKTKNKLDAYFEKPNIVIEKYDLENAIRLFVTLVLFREKDRENKIKNNRRNLIDYLKGPDLWDNKKFDREKEKFNENLNELKQFKIQINQTLWLYNYLVENKDIDEYKEMEKSIMDNNAPAPEPPMDGHPPDDSDTDPNSPTESESSDSGSDSEEEPDRDQ